MEGTLSRKRPAPAHTSLPYISGNTETAEAHGRPSPREVTDLGFQPPLMEGGDEIRGAETWQPWSERWEEVGVRLLSSPTPPAAPPHPFPASQE